MLEKDLENQQRTTELASKERETGREESILFAEKLLGAKTAENIRKLYSLVEADTYKWFASLYDGKVGGFYYSASARDGEGFLPDLESTNQTINFSIKSGLLSSYEDFPEELRGQMICFAQGLQSSEDGFFYHPQWGKDISPSKRGRDLGGALGILKKMGGKPLYDTPNGHKGVLGAPKNSEGKSGLQNSEPSRATPVTEVLQSLSDFDKYLNSLEINTHSYSIGNLLASQSGVIKAAGREYSERLIEFLNSKQNPKYGLWGDEVNFSTVNGLFKINSVYSGLGIMMPNSKAAFESTMKMALLEDLGTFREGDVFICSLYNPLHILNSLIGAVCRFEGEDVGEELRGILLSRSEELTARTYKKLLPFKCNDGGFSYFHYGPSVTQQGSVACLAGIKESDINATGISCNGVIGNLCAVLKMGAPRFFGTLDREIFIEELLRRSKV